MRHTYHCGNPSCYECEKQFQRELHPGNEAIIKFGLELIEAIKIVERLNSLAKYVAKAIRNIESWITNNKPRG